MSLNCLIDSLSKFLMEKQNGIHITFRALTGVKVNMNWPTWDGENQVDDPNEPGKKLWIPNFAEGVNDPTNAALLKRIGEIVFQDLKVRYKCIGKKNHKSSLRIP
jgi:hypothetical protein